MCRTFGISRQAYYKQCLRNDQLAMEKKQIIDMVQQYRRVMPRLGTLKLYHLLKPRFDQLGIKCGRDKLFNILRAERMLVKRKKNFTCTTNSHHRYWKHPNRIKELDVKKPEQVWVSDITYIKTRKQPLYLSLVTDAYSKQIMGFELADNLKVASTLKALKMAVKRRQYPNRTLIHHSDRGLQYCAPAYTEILEKQGIDISMTTKYDPYENAIAERVNGILKTEFDIGEGFIEKKDAQKAIKQSINTYNKMRPHLSCKYRTPEQAHSYPNFEPIHWKSKKTKHKVLVNRTT